MFLENLERKAIIIYGTGHVARKFYRALGKYHLQSQVQCFVRTEAVRSGERFEGVPVYCFKNISIESDTLVCLAVHESIRDEIEDTVKKVTGQYIWIYPYLYELMLGKPEQRDVEVAVSKLLKGFQEDLRLGVRLAAIEQQDKKNDYGFDYYVRAQMLHCDQETARHRLGQLLRLIVRWKKEGYERTHVLTLNRNYGVIDGNHRLAMAVYMGQERMFADIYPTNLSVEDIHGREPMLSKELLLERGFTPEAVRKLEKIQERYVNAYGIE